MNKTKIKHGYSLMVRDPRGAVLNPGAQISVKFYFMHISQNKLFFPLIHVFFDANSKSEIRIFRTALVFEL